MNNQELEIKLLNVDVDFIRKKLEGIGAIFKKDIIQKIYTYDCYDPIIMYELMIKDYKITKNKNSLKKIITFLRQLNRIFNKKDINIFKKITNFEYLDFYIENNIVNLDISILENSKIKEVIKKTKERFFKWIRLRESGNEIELTVKYIYSVSKNYKIEEVKEIEIKVDSFEEPNKLIEELGYFRKKLVEKRRISYEFGNNSIEIDMWPLIPPYVEIEGINKDEIYELASQLGFKKEEIKVMNTEDVYLDNGIDLTSFEILTFNEQLRNQ